MNQTKLTKRKSRIRPCRKLAFVGLLGIILLAPSSSFCPLNPLARSSRDIQQSVFIQASNKHEDEDDDDDWIAAQIEEVIQNAEEKEKEEDEEWIPDREKAKRKREGAFQSTSAASPLTKKGSIPTVDATVVMDGNDPNEQTTQNKKVVSPYTDEEEEVIRSMGGKTNAPNKREPGYLGDSTLQEIATDYSVPVCYLADVLCLWGVPVPIHVNDRLGDLVTGEQAFALLEAVNSLDIAALHDRYSNMSLINLCHHWSVDLSEGLEMAMKEGWSLPFGVHSVLRVEQEDELVRVLGRL